jgi:hypothetical protein
MPAGDGSMTSEPDAMAGDQAPQAPGALGWQHVETLTLPEVVITILRSRQKLPQAAAAAIVREPRGGEFLVRVHLLPAAPPAGGAATADGTGAPQDAGEVIAAFAARALSQDLADAFGSNDVIILK